MALLEQGDLEGAGFVAAEIDEPPVKRGQWLQGILAFCEELYPDSAAIRFARQGSETDSEVQWTVRAAAALRKDILAEDSHGTARVRALYVAEHSVRVLHNMSIEACRHKPPFDRDTGWWIVRSALAGNQAPAERDGWMAHLFPANRGEWSQ